MQYVARVFQNCLAVDSERSRYGIGRGAIREALRDF